MSSALRLTRAARPLTSSIQTARFSIASRMRAEDAFNKREEASENMYIRNQEKEKLAALKKKIEHGEGQLAKDKKDLEELSKKEQK